MREGWTERMLSEVAVEMERHSSATFTPTLQTPALIYWSSPPHTCTPLLTRATIPSINAAPYFDTRHLVPFCKSTIYR